MTLLTNISGAIADTNLDDWELDLATFGSDKFVAIASGNQSLDGKIAQFNPNIYSNGLYQLKLRATNIDSRTTVTQAVVESVSINSPSQYKESNTNLSWRKEIEDRRIRLRKLYLS